MTRASRARMRAVGAKRRTLYGVVSSAYDSGRDGRLSLRVHLTQNRHPDRAPCSADSPRTIEHHRCASPNRDTRGVNDPPGRQSQAGTGVVHAPISVPPSGRAPDGRHRAPSDCTVICRTISHLSACWLQREQKGLPNRRRNGTIDVDHKGDNLEILTRPPFRPRSRKQPGKENGNERGLRDGCRRAIHAIARLGGAGHREDGERRSGDADQVRQVQVLTREDDALDRRQSSIELLHE